MDAHAGKLDLESVKDIGTLVVVKLPVLQPETRESLQKQFRRGGVAVRSDGDAWGGYPGVQSRGLLFDLPISGFLINIILHDKEEWI